MNSEFLDAGVIVGDAVCKTVPKWSINRCLNSLMGADNTKYGDHPHPFQPLLTALPVCNAPIIDALKMPLAFGHLEIPKLHKELMHPESEESLCAAVYTLCDVVHNPEKACEAIHLDILNPLKRLLSHNNPFVRLCCLEAIKILSIQPQAKKMILCSIRIMKELYSLFRDEVEHVRHKSCELLNALTSNWIGIDVIIELGFVPELINRLASLNKDASPNYLICLLTTLENLLAKDVEVKVTAVRYDVLGLKTLLQHPDEGVKKAANGIFLELYTMKEGMVGCFAHNIINDINATMKEDSPEVVAMTMFTLIPSDVRSKLLDKALLDKLLDIWMRPHYKDTTRLHVLTSLVILSEVPQGREYLKTQLPEIISQSRDMIAINDRLDTLVDLILKPY